LPSDESPASIILIAYLNARLNLADSEPSFKHADL
jgi:hypothetical protein